VLEKDPNDPRANYYLGTFYLSQSVDKTVNGKIVTNAKIDKDEIRKAIGFINRYIAVSDFYEEKYLAKWYLCQAYFHLEDIPMTKQTAYDMFEQMSEMPLAQEVLAELYMNEYKLNANARHLVLAEFWFKNARSKKIPFVSCFFPEPFFTWLPWERLAELYSIASQKDPPKILDAIMAAEATLSFQDFPESRRPHLESVLNSWRALIDEDTNSDGSGDRKHDNVFTINTGNGPKVQDKSGRFNPANMVRVKPSAEAQSSK